MLCSRLVLALVLALQLPCAAHAQFLVGLGASLPIRSPPLAIPLSPQQGTSSRQGLGRGGAQEEVARGQRRAARPAASASVTT